MLCQALGLKVALGQQPAGVLSRYVSQAALPEPAPFSFGFYRFLSLIPSLKKHLTRSTFSLPN